MKYILFFLFSSLTTFGKNSILIRYSFEDCSNCNVNLNQILEVDADQKVICFKETYKDDEELELLNSELIKHNFKIVYSDSIYNAKLFDSSIFSFVVVFNTKKESVFCKHLKNANINEVLSYFKQSQTKKNKLILPNGGCPIEYSDNFIYCIDDHRKRILVVSKNDIDVVMDTIKVNTDFVLKDCYLKNFGDTVQYQRIKNEQKLNPLEPLSTEILTAKCQKDYLYILCSNKYIVENNHIKGIYSFNSMIVFKGSQFIKSIPFDINNAICDTILKDCYTPLSASFLIHDNNFYSTVRKKVKSNKNVLIAKVGFDEKEKPYLMNLMPIYMPETHANGPFYNLLDLMQCNEYFMLHYYPILYNVLSNLEIKLPIYLAPNEVSRNNIMMGKFKINSEIKSYNIKNDTLTLVYKSNDTLKFSKIAITKRSSVLYEDKTLATAYNPEEMDFFQVTLNGYYYYSSKLQKFIYNKN